MWELLAWNGAFALGGVLALLVVLAALHACERRVSRFLFRRIGWRASLYPTAVIGVPLHELSHLLAAKLFGHRIVGYSLFEPDTTTGTLGYVRHAYRRRNPWQLLGTFFIGIAPFMAGSLALVVIGASMVPGDARVELVAWMWQMVAGNAFELPDLAIEPSPWWAVQAYLAVAIASHMAPSPRDLAGGLLGGALFAVALALVVTLLTAAELTALPCLLLLTPVVAASLVAVVLQATWAGAVALVTAWAR